MWPLRYASLSHKPNNAPACRLSTTLCIKKDVMNIEQLIAESTRHIERNYFQLPIDGQEDPVYRERVYCYELYHQLRSRWPHNTDYELSGEVDKSGHPLIRGNNLDRIKPDLLVHIPGDMGGNHAIIEVKPITATRNGIFKDLSTLTAFLRYANYEKAIYLLYGDGDIETILAVARDCQEQDQIALNLIEFWWHQNVGSPAFRVANNA